MELSDFSSLIEVAVTLNMAFVAVEYVKSYTKVLCNQVFKLQDFVAASFDNFVASVIKVWNKANAVRTEIEKSSEKLQRKCSTLQKDVEKLINVNELCAQLEVEPPTEQ